MGIHEWSYDNEISLDPRYRVPLRDQAIALKDVKAEVELGFDRTLGYAETQRCLNCDIETVFTRDLCIECDACVDICPMDCITFTTNGPEGELRQRLMAPAANLSQDLYVSDTLKTGRVMVKDEDVCLHCGLCAERCPTGAWDMQKFLLDLAHAYGTTTMPEPRLKATNDFVVKFANVNGSGSASANRLFARSVLRMGVPIASRNIFPSNIQGLPTWYEVRVTEAGHLGRRGGVDLMVAMNPQTWDRDLREIEPGGYLFYDSTRPLPPSKFRERREHGRHAAHAICNERYADPAPASAVQEHHLCRGARVALGDRNRGDRAPDRRASFATRRNSSRRTSRHFIWGVTTPKRISKEQWGCACGARRRSAIEFISRATTPPHSAPSMAARPSRPGTRSRRRRLWRRLSPSIAVASASTGRLDSGRYAIVQAEDELPRSEW